MRHQAFDIFQNGFSETLNLHHHLQLIVAQLAQVLQANRHSQFQVEELSVEEEPGVGQVPRQRNPTRVICQLSSFNALHEQRGQENSAQIDSGKNHFLGVLNIGQLRREGCD